MTASYQGRAQSVGFNPVRQSTYVPKLKENAQSQQQAMDAAFQVQQSTDRANEKNTALMMDQLSQFSSTLKNFVASESEKKAKNDLNEGIAMAYEDGLVQPKSLTTKSIKLIYKPMMKLFRVLP